MKFVNVAFHLLNRLLLLIVQAVVLRCSTNPLTWEVIKSAKAQPSLSLHLLNQNLHFEQRCINVHAHCHYLRSIFVSSCQACFHFGDFTLSIHSTQNNSLTDSCMLSLLQIFLKFHLFNESYFFLPLYVKNVNFLKQRVLGFMSSVTYQIQVPGTQYVVYTC